MVFVGVCIIFQAITSDIYVYNKMEVTAPATTETTSVITAARISTPTTKP